MRALLGKVRTRVGMAVLGGVLIVGAGAGTAAAVVGGTAPQEVADVETVPTEPAVTPSTLSPEAPVSAAVEPPAADTPAPTVADVTEPEPASETIPAPRTNADGSLPEGWLPPQNPGEPPIAPDPGPGAMEKLPGEPGYVSPTG